MPEETTDKYWDCECKYHYIHSKNQPMCSVCGASAENQPDSHSSEVITMLEGLVQDLHDAIRRCNGQRV